jgi:hypothetical protein
MTNIAQQINDLLTSADCHQIQAVYAGIGSRTTPQDVLDLMARKATTLDTWEWTLRSGGAPGADETFEANATRPEIYLPWGSFTNRPRTLDKPSMRAMEIASKFHPQWHAMTRGQQKLHARNVHQILGADCMSPCSMVICWTPDGSTGITTARTGGTGQALRIAYDRKIPIFNLQRPDHREAWEEATKFKT